VIGEPADAEGQPSLAFSCILDDFQLVSSLVTARGDRLAVLLQLAQQQHSVVVERQVRECGISSKVMNGLIADGWFRRVCPGAFAVAGRTPSRWEDAVAVGLLAGPGAVLSHGTAAAIHGLPGLIAPKVPELTVANPRHPRPPGAVVHRVDHIDPCDIEIRRGLQVTTPERTVIDLASQLDGPLLARILDEGSIAGLWTSEDVMACAERVGTKGRRGSVTLRTLLAERGHEPQADNMLELRMIRVLAPYAPFETQFHLVLDGELLILDIAWPQWRVGAEVDGWWVRNQSRTKFDRTFSRANLLIAHHWRIAHLTSTMDDLTVLRDVGRLLPPHVFEQAMSRRAGSR